MIFKIILSTYTIYGVYCSRTLNEKTAYRTNICNHLYLPGCNTFMSNLTMFIDVKTFPCDTAAIYFKLIVLLCMYKQIYFHTVEAMGITFSYVIILYLNCVILYTRSSAINTEDIWIDFSMSTVNDN